jgi:hypothetical protein
MSDKEINNKAIFLGLIQGSLRDFDLFRMNHSVAWVRTNISFDYRNRNFLRAQFATTVAAYQEVGI